MNLLMRVGESWRIVQDSLGPVFWLMVGLWSATVFQGLTLALKFLLGEVVEDLVATAARLHRIGAVAMVGGIFGQTYEVAASLGGINGGISSINGLVLILSKSLYCTLAGVCISLFSELLILMMLWFSRPEKA